MVCQSMPSTLAALTHPSSHPWQRTGVEVERHLAALVVHANVREDITLVGTAHQAAHQRDGAGAVAVKVDVVAAGAADA